MPRSEQGIFPERYKVIPRCLIFITRDQQVLLLKGHAQKRLWANRYNGIGGHIEYGEDILTSARRELLEESGLRVDNLWLCGNVMVDASQDLGISIFIFRGEYSSGELLESDEGELEWVDFGNILNIPLVEDLYTLLPLVLKMKKGDQPIIAHSFYDEKDRLILQLHYTPPRG